MLSDQSAAYSWLQYLGFENGTSRSRNNDDGVGAPALEQRNQRRMPLARFHI